MINGRRRLLAIVVLAAVLHALGIARTVLPAQDGLKFIRVARQFQERPTIDVIRGSDRHPLYPALIAVVEPVVAWSHRPGPDAWRIARRRRRAGGDRADFPALWTDAGVVRRPDRVTLLFVVLPSGRGGARHAERQPGLARRPHRAVVRRSRPCARAQGHWRHRGLRARGRPRLSGSPRGCPGAAGRRHHVRAGRRLEARAAAAGRGGDSDLERGLPDPGRRICPGQGRGLGEAGPEARGGDRAAALGFGSRGRGFRLAWTIRAGTFRPRRRRCRASRRGRPGREPR